jgi:hypothetical protein
MDRVNRIVNHVNGDVEKHRTSRRVRSWPASQQPVLTVTIVGGGNSGHVCAALFHENMKGEIRTQLLTTRPSNWTNSSPVVRFPDGSTQTGKLYKVSDDPKELLPHSDIVLWTGPVNATKECFENIRPFINPKTTVVGTIFAQGLIHLLAHRVFGAEVRFFALRNIPWLCRVVEQGRESQIVGGKSSIGIMTVGLDKAYVKSKLEPLFVVQKTGKWEPVMDILPDFCPIVFNPANQIIHPARYWGMFRNWTGTPLSGDQEPSEWLYRGMDETAGQCLVVLDEELQSLKNAYHAATGAKGCESVIPLRDRLLDQYGDQIEDTSTLAKMVGTNKAYSEAKTPVVRTKLGVMPAANHRVVLDDIGWGLCALISIAERLEYAGIRTPTTMMRTMVEWHQKMMGKEFLYNGKLRGRDCTDLVLLRPDDALELVAKPPETSSSWLDAVEAQSEENRIGNP